MPATVIDDQYDTRYKVFSSKDKKKVLQILSATTRHNTIIDTD